MPVRSDERTALYSHRELRALTSTDPRNELDELSEPRRFGKDVKKPDAKLESGARVLGGGGLLLTFLAGAAIGGVLVALTTSKTDPGFPGDQKDLAHQATRKPWGQPDRPAHPWSN